MSRYSNRNNNNNNNNNNNDDYIEIIVKAIGLVAVGGTIAFAANRLKYAGPNMLLIKTGFGINNSPKVSRVFVRWPFQEVRFVPLTPTSISGIVPVITKDNLNLEVPYNITVAPNVCGDLETDKSEIIKYSRNFTDVPTEERDQIMQRIAETQIRLAAAGMDVEAIKSDRIAFQTAIGNNVQIDFNQFGLKIQAAGIQLNAHYFKQLEAIATANASKEVAIRLAEQRKDQAIAEALRTSEARKESSIREKEAKLVENENTRQIIESTTALDKYNAEQALVVRNAKTKTDIEANIYREQLSKQEEEARQVREQAKLRSDELVKTNVQAEQVLAEAQGKSNSIRVMADANLYKVQQEAKAMQEKVIAEAIAQARNIVELGEANKTSKIAEAIGIQTYYEAQANGMTKIIESFNSKPDAIAAYLNHRALESGLPEKVAKSYSDALQGLSPKINIISGSGQEAGGALSELTRSVINTTPFLNIAKDQLNYAGIKIPFLNELTDKR